MALLKKLTGDTSVVKRPLCLHSMNISAVNLVVDSFAAKTFPDYDDDEG